MRFEISDSWSSARNLDDEHAISNGQVGQIYPCAYSELTAQSLKEMFVFISRCGINSLVLKGNRDVLGTPWSHAD